MSDETVARGVPDDRARWAAAVTAELGVSPEVLAQVTGPVLDMVRDVAHQVNRPSAPLTAFLVGLASGAAAAGGSDPAAEVRSRLDQVARLIEAWEPTPDA